MNKAGIRNEELHFGAMVNFDTRKNAIGSQSISDSEEDNESDATPDLSDDDTDGKEITAPPRQGRTGSTRTRSTIL